VKIPYVSIRLVAVRPERLVIAMEIASLCHTLMMEFATMAIRILRMEMILMNTNYLSAALN
jgi:hypothetical protein